MVLILLTFQGYKWAHVSAVAGIVLLYFSLMFSRILEPSLDEIVYHYLLIK
jgi:hypothetical protein